MTKEDYKRLAEWALKVHEEAEITVGKIEADPQRSLLALLFMKELSGISIKLSAVFNGLHSGK